MILTMDATKLIVLAFLVLSAVLVIVPLAVLHWYSTILGSNLVTFLCLLFIFLYSYYISNTNDKKQRKLQFIACFVVVMVQFLLLVIVGISSTSLACYILGINPVVLLVYWFYLQKLLRSNLEVAPAHILEVEIEEVLTPKRFNIKDVIAMTEIFKYCINDTQPVFRGTLPNGKEVTVKSMPLISNSSRDNFIAEITILAQLKHENLCKLVGYCSSSDSAYVIYEYLENGSLSHWIFSEDSNERRVLTMRLRYQVALSIAKVLDYLHCHRKLFHLDVSPNNIILDGEFKAYLTGLGISELRKRNMKTNCPANIMYSIYTAPEILLGGEATDKCDVYSFGLLLLVLVSGQKNIIGDFRTGNELAKTMYKILKEGRIMEVVDKSIIIDEEKGEMLEALVKVGLLCVQEDPQRRPTMAQVIVFLLGQQPLPLTNFELPVWVAMAQLVAVTYGHRLNSKLPHSIHREL